ncbi:type VI secretion system-associated FHA domain protein TagH [uncultured Litoreibacter sp.]|uniref:type VI secretion system-associated FHA domain protein TagH n=1 Tax=uncultured Litoreibacter sp. TaxID=1392394 RepID=UPI0026366621|nr:type VI secretion system-associated FHA domain protein TagH [uncultured Litoreibacter sp.]
MKLTLRIENHDFLEDGGPLEISVEGRGILVGRDGAMDWTLPDPARHISSQHFEITFQNGVYWLNDTSTNGTYLQGHSHRVESPYQIAHMDRLQVGHYIIVIVLEGAAASWGADAPADAPAASGGDPWNLGGGPAEPVNVTPTEENAWRGDFGDNFIVNPTPPATPTPPPAAPAPAAPDASPFAAAAPVAPPAPPAAPPASAPVAPTPPAAAPAPEGFAPASAPAAAPAAPAAATPPTAAAPVAAGPNADAVLRAFCEGAGLPLDSLPSKDPMELARELGQSLRVTTEELKALLGARAATKQFVKSGSRTMMGQTDNNPLKFMPDAAQALDVMYLNPRQGYLDGTSTLVEAFGDIKRHQTAVYSAIQPALARLLEDLSPEAIEKRSGGASKLAVVGGGKRARNWEVFVERWDAKTHPYENGMLDVFLAYFAEAYDSSIKAGGGQ